MNEPDEPGDLLLRLYEPSDARGVVEVVRTCYGGYGQVIELDTLDADLLAIPRHYPPPHAAFWVLADRDRVVGTTAVVALPDGAAGEATLKRVFLVPAYRGRGLGKRLVLHAASWARERGARRLRFWSDELYEAAHGLYRGVGARETGEVRLLGGRNAVREREFVWELV